MELIKHLKNQIVAVAIAFLICITIIISTIAIGSRDNYIRNIGSSSTTDGKFTNTISVSGDGRVFAKPDMAEVRISVQETEKTSNEALDKVNKRINKIQDILKDNGVDKDDIKTTNLSIYPEYNWRNDTRELEGYQATQSLNFQIKDIDEKASQVSKVIDKIAEEDDEVQIGNISFDLEDKTDIYKQARELAYEKAEQKGKELADLSGVKLLKPISISDVSTDYNTSSNVQTNTSEARFSLDAAETAGSPSQVTELSTGQLEIRMRLNVSFGIE